MGDTSAIGDLHAPAARCRRQGARLGAV